VKSCILVSRESFPVRAASLSLVSVAALCLVACLSPDLQEDLTYIPLSDGGIAPAASIVAGDITTISVAQQGKADGMMEGVYYGYFYDQWPWYGGSGGSNTTLGPSLSPGTINCETDLLVESVALFYGRLRFSIALACWEGRNNTYRHTEYDFWNGPEANSGIVWTDTVRIYKGLQAESGKWYHLKLDLSLLIRDSYQMSSGYLQAVYLVVEWDGNNFAVLKFKNFRIYKVWAKEN